MVKHRKTLIDSPSYLPDRSENRNARAGIQSGDQALPGESGGAVFADLALRWGNNVTHTAKRLNITAQQRAAHAGFAAARRVKQASVGRPLGLFERLLSDQPERASVRFEETVG
jgi:hypothetical protein